MCATHCMVPGDTMGFGKPSLQLGTIIVRLPPPRARCFPHLPFYSRRALRCCTRETRIPALGDDPRQSEGGCSIQKKRRPCQTRPLDVILARNGCTRRLLGLHATFFGYVSIREKWWKSLDMSPLSADYQITEDPPEELPHLSRRTIWRNSSGPGNRHGSPLKRKRAAVVVFSSPAHAGGRFEDYFQS